LGALRFFRNFWASETEMSEAEKIRSAIGQAVEYLSQNPEEARYTDSAAVATLDAGLRVNVRDSGGNEITTDMPKGIGGGETAPSAGWLFRAALAACATTLVAMRAATEGITLAGLQVIVDGESNDLGILGIDDSIPAGPLSLRVRVTVGAQGMNEEGVRELVAWAIDHCPVYDGARRAVPVSVEIEVV
jgi:uncharacterized OsmC-like protein